MKKLIWLASLVVVAGASFAFLPRQTAVPQYGMLVLRYDSFDNAASVDVTTITGAAPKLEFIKLKGNRDERYGNLHLLETTRLSELAVDNWTLVSSHSRSSFHGTLNGTSVETSFVLVKR